MENTEIAWTHHTINWWMGCTMTSPGCTNCYAKTECERFDHAGWGPDATRVFVINAHDNARKFDAAARKAGRKDVVFCSSLSDFFEDKAEVAPWREDAWKTIRGTPNLVWIILTKRPENITAMLPPDWGDDGYDNVCLAATVENSDDKILGRVDILRAIPARWRMLSVEPMLGPVDLRGRLDGIHMVVCGGESHKVADPEITRPMHPDWARDLRDACTEAEVCYFFKQWGSWATTPTPGLKKPASTEWKGLTIFFAGTNKRDKAHPALLDGETWRQHPFGPEVDLDSPSALASRRDLKRVRGELTPADHADFKKLDDRVRQSAEAFVEVGRALGEIRSRKLWRAGGFDSWKKYCAQYFGQSKTQANRLITASGVAGNLMDQAPIGAGSEMVLPTAESQVRPLTRLKEPEQQLAAWNEAARRDGGVPTARTVEAVVTEILPPADKPARPAPATDPAATVDQVIGEKPDIVDDHTSHEKEEKDACTTSPKPPNNSFLKRWITIISEIRCEARAECRTEQILKLTADLISDIEYLRQQQPT